MIEIAHANDLDKEAYAAAEFYNKAVGRGTFNHEHFKRFWAGIISHGNGFILKRCSDSGEMQESVGVLLCLDPLTGNKTAQVAFWYVGSSPNGLEGGLLFRQLLVELKELQVSKLLVSVPNFESFKHASVFLEGMGFGKRESVYDIWLQQLSL